MRPSPAAAAPSPPAVPRGSARGVLPPAASGRPPYDRQPSTRCGGGAVGRSACRSSGTRCGAAVASPVYPSVLCIAAAAYPVKTRFGGVMGQFHAPRRLSPDPDQATPAPGGQRCNDLTSSAGTRCDSSAAGPFGGPFLFLPTHTCCTLGDLHSAPRTELCCPSLPAFGPPEFPKGPGTTVRALIRLIIARFGQVPPQIAPLPSGGCLIKCPLGKGSYRTPVSPTRSTSRSRRRTKPPSLL